MRNQTCMDAFVFNLEHNSKPIKTLCPPNHLTSIDYNIKEQFLIGGGCYNGQVCWWDTRICPEPVGETSFESSHTDAVYFFKWIGKTGTEFFTGSSDGFVKWWDIRSIKEPVNSFLMLPSSIINHERIFRINCLCFEPTISSKFMVGTDQGSVVSCRMQPKQGSNEMILGEFNNCYFAKIMAVDRNPFYPKNFLTVGDNTCKIWCEDIKTSPIIVMKPSAERLSGGAWSPTKISVFFTARLDGTVEVWDFLHNQSEPILPIKVADYPLNCIKVFFSINEHVQHLPFIAGPQIRKISMCWRQRWNDIYYRDRSKSF